MLPFTVVFPSWWWSSTIRDGRGCFAISPWTMIRVESFVWKVRFKKRLLHHHRHLRWWLILKLLFGFKCPSSAALNDEENDVIWGVFEIGKRIKCFAYVNCLVNEWKITPGRQRINKLGLMISHRVSDDAALFSTFRSCDISELKICFGNVLVIGIDFSLENMFSF